jgi:squalene monooxygenase
VRTTEQYEQLPSATNFGPSPHAYPADVGEDWSEGQPVSGVKYKAADGSIREARAHLTIVCDGMYSNFRKPLTESADVHHPSFFVGLLLRNVALPYANHGHVVLAEPSPVLFYPISPTEVRQQLHWGGGTQEQCCS